VVLPQVPTSKGAATAWMGGSLLGGIAGNITWIVSADVEEIFEEDAGQAGMQRLRQLVKRQFGLS
jgi:hypothetical protein